MKKIEKTFLHDVLNFVKKYDNDNINKFIKNTGWIIPFVYIIGTFILLIRNKIYNLPFSPISLIQFSLIVLYTVIFVLGFGAIEYTFVRFIQNKEINKALKFIEFIICLMIEILFIAFILSILIDNAHSITRVIIIYYVIYPIVYSILSNTKKKTKKIITIIFTIVFYMTLILIVPTQMGGLKYQNVVFHDTTKDITKDYKYFGNYDGLYQFMDDNRNIYLIPFENGYIEYNNYNLVTKNETN